MLHFAQAILAAGLILLAGLPFPVPRTRAQEAARPSLDRQAEELRHRIRERRDEVGRTTRDERQALESLDTIGRSLNEAHSRLKEAREALSAIDAELIAIRERAGALEADIRQREAQAGHRLVALYKLDAVGELHVLVGADSLQDFSERQRILSTILEADHALLSELAERDNRLRETRETLEKRRRERIALEETHERQLAVFLQRQGEKEKALREIRGKRDLARASLAALERSAKELEAKIASLERPPSPDVVEDGGGSEFARRKGLLKMPVGGKIVSFFGPFRRADLGVTNFRSGVGIQADRGEPVRAVLGGKVIFADWFKGYGNLIILDHGNHYCSLYAHAEELFKATGDTVNADEVIATVGDSGTADGPSLHFEIRHHGKPIDPLEWLNKG